MQDVITCSEPKGLGSVVKLLWFYVVWRDWKTSLKVIVKISDIPAASGTEMCTKLFGPVTVVAQHFYLCRELPCCLWGPRTLWTMSWRWMSRLYLVHLLGYEEGFWGLKHGLCERIMERLIVVTSLANISRTSNFSQCLNTSEFSVFYYAYRAYSI
jgi:hypothetical protein